MHSGASNLAEEESDVRLNRATSGGTRAVLHYGVALLSVASNGNGSHETNGQNGDHEILSWRDL
jgi:hypothetical protein